MRRLQSKKDSLAKEDRERLEKEQAEARARMAVFETAANNMQRIWRGLVRHAVPACLPACMPACLPACLLACLPACLFACRPICLTATD
jgi:hypothetical protein